MPAVVDYVFLMFGRGGNQIKEGFLVGFTGKIKSYFPLSMRTGAFVMACVRASGLDYAIGI